jgi:hypothetical protein
MNKNIVIIALSVTLALVTLALFGVSSTTLKLSNEIVDLTRELRWAKEASESYHASMLYYLDSYSEAQNELAAKANYVGEYVEIEDWGCLIGDKLELRVAYAVVETTNIPSNNGGTFCLRVFQVAQDYPAVFDRFGNEIPLNAIKGESVDLGNPRIDQLTVMVCYIDSVVCPHETMSYLLR